MGQTRPVRPRTPPPVRTQPLSPPVAGPSAPPAQPPAPPAPARPAAGTVLLIAADRALHGLGAGIALPATLALAWERSPRWRRLLSRWWAAVLVISLLGSVPLLRDRLTGGDWRAALHPFPWLTAVALAVTAGYVALTGTAGPPVRGAVTLAERSQLALLAAPAAGLSVLTAGVSSQLASSVMAAAVVATFVLACLAVATSADAVTGGERGARGRLCFPLVGACAGFVLAPTAGAIGTLRPLAAGPEPALRALGIPLAAAATACILGTGMAWLLRAGVPAPAGTHAARYNGGRVGTAGTAGRGGRAGRGKSGNRPLRCVVAGLACAAAGLLVARAAGLNGSPAELAGAYALLAGGLAMALSASIAEATPAGALGGLSLALAGALMGYLAAGAIQIRQLASVASAPARLPAATSALTSALARAAGSWELAAAAAAAAAAAGALFIGRARRGKGGVPVRG